MQHLVRLSMPDWAVLRAMLALDAPAILPPADQDYGARNYSAPDLEGKLWSFGGYDAWTHVG